MAPLSNEPVPARGSEHSGTASCASNGARVSNTKQCAAGKPFHFQRRAITQPLEIPLTVTSLLIQHASLWLTPRLFGSEQINSSYGVIHHFPSSQWRCFHNCHKEQILSYIDHQLPVSADFIHFCCFSSLEICTKLYGFIFLSFVTLNVKSV